jgi:hypothetical protein
MNQPRVLQVTTFSIDNPDFGGKLRCHELRKALRQIFQVETLACFLSDTEGNSGFEYWFKGQDALSAVEHGHFLDWGIFSCLQKRPEKLQLIHEQVREFGPDIIWVEQPYLWELVQNLKEEGSIPCSAQIIYSSHNTEVELKKSIYQSALPEDVAGHGLKIVDKLEKDTIRSSDWSLAVLEKDSDYIRKVRPDLDVYTFGNGHSVPTKLGVADEWKYKFQEQGSGPNWVYVGSAHPPNVNGLMELLNADLGQSPNFRIWIFGTVVHCFTQEMRERFPFVQFVGPSTVEEIDSAIIAADGVVLPIWEGGGSNLKTAQALLSTKMVVGSKYAFRGFEEFLAEQGIAQVENAEDMFELLKLAPKASHFERPLANQKLRWEFLLHALPNLVLHKWSAFRQKKGQSANLF